MFEMSLFYVQLCVYVMFKENKTDRFPDFSKPCSSLGGFSYISSCSPPTYVPFHILPLRRRRELRNSYIGRRGTCTLGGQLNGTLNPEVHQVKELI